MLEKSLQDQRNTSPPKHSPLQFHDLPAPHIYLNTRQKLVDVLGRRLSENQGSKPRSFKQHQQLQRQPRRHLHTPETGGSAQEGSNSNTGEPPPFSTWAPACGDRQRPRRSKVRTGPSVPSLQKALSRGLCTLLHSTMRLFTSLMCVRVFSSKHSMMIVLANGMDCLSGHSTYG